MRLEDPQNTGIGIQLIRSKPVGLEALHGMSAARCETPAVRMKGARRDLSACEAKRRK